MGNNNKKAFFFDFDGTLWFGRYGEKTLQALQKLHNDGHLLIYNSGRSKGNNPEERLKPVPFDCFLRGGCIVEIFGEEVFRKDFSLELIKEVLQIEREYDLLCLYEGVYGVYKRRGILPTFNGDEQDDMTILHDVKKHAISKFCIMKVKGEDGEYLPIDERAVEHLGKNCDVVDMRNYVEVTQKGTGKDVVVDIAIKKLGLKKQDCYFFGDSLNDLPAFLVGGHNVAMVQSPEELKKHAEFVTTLKEDGIYEALVHFGFLEKF